MSRAVRRPTIRLSAWATWTSPALFVLLLAALYFPTLSDLARFWGSGDTYGHGFLLLPVALFMLYHERRGIAGDLPRLRLQGAVSISALALGWAMARYVGVQLAEQLVLFAMFVVALWALCGPRGLAALAFPVGYLLLGIPVWSGLVAPLQDGNAAVASAILRELGVPVYRDGPYLAVPAGLFEVAETCAGLRFLLSTLAVMTPFAVLNLHGAGLRLVLIAASALMSILFNGLRVIAVIGAGHLTEMQSAIVHGDGHINFGWFMFALGLVASMALVLPLRRWDRAGAGRERSGGVPDAPAARGPLLAGVPALAAFAAALCLGPVASAAMWAVAPAGDAERFLSRARLLEGWADAPVPRSDEPAWSPRFRNAAGELNGAFASGEHDVRAYAAYYALQGQGAELVNPGNVEFSEEAWNFKSTSVVAAHAAHVPDVLETRLRSGDRERLVWRVYWVGGRSATTPLEAKTLQLRGWLARRAGAGVLLLSTDPGSGGADAARQALADILSETYPGLADAWQQAG